MKYLIFLPLAVLVVVLAAGNPAPMTFSLFPLPYEVKAPALLLMLVVFALGALAGGLVMSVKLLRARRALAQAQKRAARLEEEMALLRERPHAAPFLPISAL